MSVQKKEPKAMHVVEALITEVEGYKKPAEYFDEIFYQAFRCQNEFVREADKRIRTAFNDSHYVKARKDYAVKNKRKDVVKAKKKKTAEEKEELKQLTLEIGELKEKMDAKEKKYGLDGKRPLSKFRSKMTVKYRKNLSSVMVDDISQNTNQAMKKVVYENGKKVSFTKLQDFLTIETDHRNGISPRDSKADGIEHPKSHMALTTSMNDWVFGTNYFDKKAIFHASIDMSDSYMFDAVYGKHIKRMGIKRRKFKNGWHYYLTLTLEGPAPKRINDIERRANNTVGIDYGVSTIAVASDKTCIMEKLAPDVMKYEKRINHLQKMNDRLLRLANPDNYNEDGTSKKGKHIWVMSKQVRNNYAEIKQLYRQKTDYIKNCHGNLANQIIKEADHIIAEPMKYSDLQKRAKTLERKDKAEVVVNKKGEEKMVHKFKKKKRYGHSINNHSPSTMQTIMKAKAEKYGVPYEEISTAEYKATQINPVNGEHAKMGINPRWKEVNGEKVQRDLCSAYSISCAKGKAEIDLEKSKKGFKDFKEQHDACIANLKARGVSDKGTFGF